MNIGTARLYPWMESNAPYIIAGLRYVLEGVSDAVPGINWKVEAKSFPMNSQWISFFTVLVCILGYIGCSFFEWLVLRRPAFNMDKLLHRGEYAIQGEHAQAVKKPPTGLKAILPSPEFTKSDKFIYYAQMTWSLGWFAIFVTVSLYNIMFGASDNAWASFWSWNVGVTLVVGITTTIWFFIGGVYDMLHMFNVLRTAKRDVLDDGMVIKHHNLGEEAADKKEFKHEVKEFEQKIRVSKK